ncbi:DUF3105 domain-containing protein [Dactylosporangium sp. CA-139114]|uniref:DUF3105 domain-containing protein n=1 Tax=Dactylosporangium sp. CA-139114 TaxID=3239931 RepID=UPI003D970B01
MTGPFPEPPPASPHPPPHAAGPAPHPAGPAPYAPAGPAPYAPAGQPPYAPAPPAFAPAPPPKGNRGLVIAVVSVAGVLALLCAAGAIGAFWLVNRADGGKRDGGDIAGLIDYRLTHPDWLERDHLPADVTPSYQMVPAAGGKHFGIWQRCAGDVYDKPVIEGRAVHSLEHGAVWITYRPGLAKGDVDRLAGKVRNNDFMLMSPYEGQPSPVSLQAWGYQLRVDKADDPRVDAFVKRFRETASLEPGTPCSNGLAE